MGLRAGFDLGCSGPFPPILRDELGQATSISEMAVAHFSHFIMISIAQSAFYPGLLWRASVAGIALSCVPQSVLFFYPVRCLFPCSPFPPGLPFATWATKLIVSTHYAPARRHAQALLLRLRVSADAGFWEKRDWQAGGVPGEHSVTVERLVSFSTSSISSTSLPLYFKLYHVLQIGPLFGGAGNTQGFS